MLYQIHCPLYHYLTVCFLLFSVFFRVVDHLLLVHYDRLLLFLFASGDGEIDMQGPGSDPGLVLEEDLPFPVQVIDPRIYIIPGEHPFLEFFVCPSYRLSVHIAVPLVIISFIVSVKVVDVVGCIQASVSYNDHPCISI